MSNEPPPPPPGNPPPPPPGNPPPPGDFSPNQPPPPPNYVPQQPYPQPGPQPQQPNGQFGESPEKKRSGCLIALAVVGVLGLLVVIAVVALLAFAADSFDDALDEAAADIEAEETEPAVTDATVTEAPEGEIVDGVIDEPVGEEPLEDPAVEEPAEDPVEEPAEEPVEEPAVEDDAPAGGEEALDVSNCLIVDEFTVSFEITNNSSKQSSYIIDANYLDDSGARIGDEPCFVNYVRPGERAVEGSFGSVPDGAASCEIAEVERFAAEPNGDVDEVTCAVVGLDFADDVATELVATNDSSELSDYLITFTLVRDGTRVGTGFASIENVKAGESAPGDGFSTVDGPVDGVVCDVVDVLRTAS